MDIEWETEAAVAEATGIVVPRYFVENPTGLSSSSDDHDLFHDHGLYPSSSGFTDYTSSVGVIIILIQSK